MSALTCNGLTWTSDRPGTDAGLATALGLLPEIFDARDPRPAKEQIADNYAYGGGYSPLDGWHYDRDSRRLKYPGDPPIAPVAESRLRGERLLLYPYAWLCILQDDGSFAVTRMD